MESTTCSHPNTINRHSWRFCTDCNSHVPVNPDTCRKCMGHGEIRVMKNTYRPELKCVKVCGSCKGTGTAKPIPCVCCGGASVMEVSQVMGSDGLWRGAWGQSRRNLCQACYDAEAK